MFGTYRYVVEKGSAPDAYGSPILFTKDGEVVTSKFLDLKCWDQPLLVTLSHDGVDFGDDIELDPDDPTYPVYFAASGFKVKNKDTGVTGRFELRCFW